MFERKSAFFTAAVLTAATNVGVDQSDVDISAPESVSDQSASPVSVTSSLRYVDGGERSNGVKWDREG